jgi:hypothetical protein
MNRKRVLALVSGPVAIAGVALLLIMGVFPGAAGRGSPGVSAPDVVNAPLVANAAVTPAVQETASAPGSPREGIQVHGHWTIEVTNPDGTLAERREFDNALQPDGAQVIAKVLGRENSVGGWQIDVEGEENAFLRNSAPFRGMIVENSSYPSLGTNVFTTLTVSVPTSGANVRKLVLSGTATAQRNGTINRVQTYVYAQNSSTPPSSSYSSASFGFTSASLSPVNLLTGQQVSVTVVISFSSPPSP